MQIEISSDNNIDGGEKLNAHVKTVVEEALSRFSKRITKEKGGPLRGPPFYTRHCHSEHNALADRNCPTRHRAAEFLGTITATARQRQYRR